MRHIITALLLLQGFHFSSFCQSGSDSVSVEYLNYGLCFGDSSYFLISDTTGIDSVFWHFNDHPSGPFNTSTEFNPVHLFSHTGSFDVELIVYIDGDYLVVIQTVTIYEYPSDLFLTDSMLCFGEPVAVVYSQPDLPGAVFSWDFAGGTTAGGTGPGPYLVSYDQPGEYIISMEVTRYGCTSESQNSIIIPGPIAIDIASQDVLCYGESEGFIDLSVSGGTGPYAFLWSYCGKETEDIMNITAGTYFVTVTDANYCQEVRTVVIEQPSDPLAVGYVIAGACTGGEPGNIYLDASGGTPDYTYIWQDTAADDSFMTGAEPGSYMVTVTDINACTVVLTTELTTQEFPLSAGIQVQHVSCFGLSDGSAAVDIDGGDAPYAFIWNYNAETSESLTGIPAGEYAVTTTDARLCTAAAETIVTQPEQQDIQLTGNTDICFGQQTVLSASVTGMEQDECQFMWSDASTGHSITVAPEINTTYTVTVTDTAGCTGLPVTITVEVGAPIHTEWSPAQDIICPGAVNVITFSASGGDGGPYLTVLQNGSLFTSPYIIIPQEPAVLVVITLDGCGTTPVTDTIAIPVYEPYKFDVKTDRIAGCEPLEVHFSETGEGNATAVFWDFDNDSVIDAENTICPAFIYGSEGVYDVSITVEDMNGCVFSETLMYKINVFERPEALFSLDRTKTSILAPDFSITNLSTDTYLCIWDFGDGYTTTRTDPAHSYSAPGSYTVSLVAESYEGCRDSLSKDVVVTDESTFFAPTAFVPDNDGNNDVFIFRTNGISTDNFRLMIFDRWGNTVFETNDPGTGWNGRNRHNKLMETGVYTWICMYCDYTGAQYKRKGEVTLIR